MSSCKVTPEVTALSVKGGALSDNGQELLQLIRECLGIPSECLLYSPIAVLGVPFFPINILIL